MTDGMRFEVDWLDREHGDLVERATYASLKIEAAGQLVTEVNDSIARTTRDRVRVSAHRLACWFVANWWRLRWEPGGVNTSWLMSHNLAAAGGGYVWPDVTIACDGEMVAIDARSTPRSEAEAIRYLNSFRGDEVVDEFERGVYEFIETVRERLLAVGLPDAELHTLWAELRTEQEATDAARWRQVEALLGFDPDEAPDDLMETLFEHADTIGEDAMREVASASKSDAPIILRELWGEARGRTTDVHVDGLEWEDESGASVAVRPPWVRGEAMARAARNKWGVEDGPVLSGSLANLVGVSRSFIDGREGWRDTPIPAAFRNGRNGRLGVVIDKGHPNARRFALLRLVADHLNSDLRDRLLPATDASTARQKFQRAFAQEFLCPWDDLQNYIDVGSPSDDDIEEVAAEFEVSPLLVTTKLVNKGVLDRGALAQWRY